MNLKSWHDFLFCGTLTSLCCGVNSTLKGKFMRTTKAYAALTATSPLGPFTFQYRDPGANEIEIQILYCGICHSDVHQARNEWNGTIYPCVPGHEIVGRVTKTGSAVKKFKEGDLAAVGCMVDSCRTCAPCKAGEEQFCENGMT